MEHRTLGKTGLDVSVVGFGCAPAAFLKSDQEQAANLIEALLDQGMNLIDTATSYPGSHEFLGQYLSKRRKDYVLVSKLGQRLGGLDAPPWSAEVVRVSVERALMALRTDRIDVMLLHSCDLKTLQNGEAMGALVKARDSGKVKHIGYSGDNDAATWAAQQADVAVIETSISVVDQANISGVLSEAIKHNVGVIAKRPIANAAWRDINSQEGMYRNYAATYTDRFVKLGLQPADLGFSGAPNEAWPEIALRFTLSQPGVTAAIVGTTKLANAEKNLDHAAKGPLPVAAIEKIRAAFKQADPQGQWTGQT